MIGERVDSIGAELRAAIDARLREGDDDHFYGAWHGGSAGQGGHAGKGAASGSGGGAPAGSGASTAAQPFAKPLEKDDASMIEAYKPWVGGLTPGETDAIEYFQGTGYEPMNLLLAGHAPSVVDDTCGRKSSEFAQGHLPQMDSAMAKAKLSEPVTVYRGGAGSALADMKPGAAISRPAFTSTTLDSADAHQFAKWNGGTVVYRMDLPKGYNAAYLDAFNRVGTGEKELLIGRGAQFHVAAVKQGADGWTEVHLVGVL